MLQEVLDWAKNLALDRVFPAIITLVLGILTIRIVMAVLKKALAKSSLEKAAHSLIKSLARVILYLLLGLMVASSLGVDVTGVVALASVLTLSVSLAIQNALANVIGGFTLLYTKPFSSGEFVEIAGQSGTVQEIGLTYTRLATADNKLVSIPNSAVTAAQIVNYSAAGTRRVDIRVKAGYQVPTQKVIDALLQAGTVNPVLLEPAPFAAVSGYGDSSIEYVLQLWTKTEDYWAVTFQVNQNIKHVFDAQQIPLATPKMQIKLDP